MRGRTVRTPQKQAALLELLAKGTSIAEATRATGIGRSSAFEWRAADADFRRAWDDAINQATEAIESVLYSKAREGDLLACIFWLKSHRPSVYNRKQIEAAAAPRRAASPKQSASVSFFTCRATVAICPSNRSRR